MVIYVFTAQFAEAAPLDGTMKEQESRLHQQEQQISSKVAAVESQQRSQEKMLQLKKGNNPLEKIELPQESPSFAIKKFQLRGLGAEKFQWIQEYLDQYVNEKIGIQGMNLLLKQINEAIVNKGYITTRVYLKEQDISSGFLMFDLAPGTIHEIRFAKPKTWGTWKTAFSVHKGDLLNIRDLEQGLEQMKRVPSQDVDIKIEPAKQPGQSDIVLTIKRTKPWKLVQSIDDSGLDSTGKIQATTAIEIDNPFAINDIFNISFNADAQRDGEKRGTRANSIYYSVPFGRQTLSFSASNYQYHQTVNTAVLPFLSSGKLENYDFGLTSLIGRDQIRKTNFEFHIIKKKRRSFINGEEISVQRQNTTALQIGITQKQYIGKSVLDTAIRYQHGVDWLGSDPGSTDGVSGEPTTQYGMFLFDVNWNTPLKMGKETGQYNLTVRIQQARNYLYGSEFFSIGGRYSVRGFDGEQTLSAENGLLIRNEFRLPIHKEHQLYAGIDYGKVYGPSAAYLLGRELVGAALGIRGTVKNAQYDVFVGWPIAKPDGFKTAAQTYGFQLTMQL